MVVERPPISDTPMELEVGPLGATPTGATLREDSPMEERGGDASPMEEVSEGGSPMPKVAEGASIGEANEATTTKGRPTREQRGGETYWRQGIQARALVKPGGTGCSSSSDCGPSRCVRMVRPRHARHRPRLFVPPPHHGRQGPSYTIRKEEVQRRKEPRSKEETQKLLSAGHIREIQYPEWLANAVLVKKANGKWRMCVDFTDLNKACPKDSDPAC